METAEVVSDFTIHLFAASSEFDRHLAAFLTGKEEHDWSNLIKPAGSAGTINSCWQSISLIHIYFHLQHPGAPSPSNTENVLNELTH